MKIRYYLRGLGTGIIIAGLICGLTGSAMSDRDVKNRARELGMLDPDELSATDDRLAEPGDTARGESAAGTETVKEAAEAAGTETVKEAAVAAGSETEKAAGAEADKTAGATGTDAAAGTADDAGKTPEGAVTTPAATDAQKPAESASQGSSDLQKPGESASQGAPDARKPAESATQSIADPQKPSDSSVKDAASDQGSSVKTGTDADRTPEAGKAADPGAGNAGASGNKGNYTLQINRGEDSAVIARKLQSAGVIDSASDFDSYLCANGYDRKLSTGTYMIAAGTEYSVIAEIITSGN